MMAFFCGVFSGIFLMSKYLNKIYARESICIGTYFSFWPRGFLCRVCASNETNRCGNVNCQYFKYKKFINVLKSAKKSINVCIALLKHDEEIEELVKLHQRGVVVQIVLDAKLACQAINAEKSIKRLLESGMQVKHIGVQGLMHHKFIIIDDKTLINTSLNHTYMGFYGNYENLEITTNKSAVAAFGNEFQYIWESC